MRFPSRCIPHQISWWARILTIPRGRARKPMIFILTINWDKSRNRFWTSNWVSSKISGISAPPAFSKCAHQKGKRHTHYSRTELQTCLRKIQMILKWKIGVKAGKLSMTTTSPNWGKNLRQAYSKTPLSTTNSKTTWVNVSRSRSRQKLLNRFRITNTQRKKIRYS